MSWKPQLWSVYYHYNMTNPTDLHGFAILSFKQELARNGFGDKLILESSRFGEAMQLRVKDFQIANNLQPDSVIGPRTASQLMRKTGYAVEVAKTIPDHLVLRLKSWESANDPAAVGPSGEDVGPVQIYLPAHEGVTPYWAVNIEYSLTFAAQNLRNDFNSLNDWAGALVAHNQGITGARKWVNAGKPSSGGALNSSGQDLYTLATLYASRVLSSAF